MYYRAVLMGTEGVDRFRSLFILLSRPHAWICAMCRNLPPRILRLRPHGQQIIPCSDKSEPPVVSHARLSAFCGSQDDVQTDPVDQGFNWFDVNWNIVSTLVHDSAPKLDLFHKKSNNHFPALQTSLHGGLSGRRHGEHFCHTSGCAGRLWFRQYDPRVVFWWGE
jgi:hypothetical protein